MNTHTVNPFDKMDLGINQKAIFQPFSHEAKTFTKSKSLDLLTFFVLQGYDLHTTVVDYLNLKSSLDNRLRISEIEGAFKLYHYDLVIVIPSKSKWCSKEKMKKLTDNYALSLLREGKEPLEEAGDLVDFFKRMSEAIEGFVKSAQKVSIPFSLSLKSLLVSFADRDIKTYKYLSKLWQIDLEEDLSEEIFNRDAIFENEIANNQYVKSPHIKLWREGGLYAFFKYAIIPDLKNNDIMYNIPIYDTPSTQYMNTFVKKYYPVEDHKELSENPEFRRERNLDIAEKAVEVLWFDKAYIDDPVYYARTNYPSTDLAHQYIPELYEKNLVSICIKDNETNDIKLYDDLINGRMVKYNRGLNYIHRFVDIARLTTEKDVLVVNSYLGDYEHKIGLIKKGSEIIKLKKDDLMLYCLQMKSVYCTPYPYFWGEDCELKTVNLSTYPVLKSLIPQQVTISPIIKNKNKIYSLYYGCPIKIELEAMSNEDIEIMCTEWLRSKYAPKGLRIEFQLLRTGGSLADIDIIGCNSNNKVVACQVTNTNNKKTIIAKSEKLEKTLYDKKIMFSCYDFRGEPQKNYNINIADVWSDFMKDETYSKLLLRLLSS